MQARTVRSRAAAAVRLLAAALALAAPPVLLAHVVGNPLPAWPIDWSLVVESIQAGLVPSSVWVDVLAVVAWVAWVVLVAMLTAEVIAVVRHRPSAPTVPGWVRHLAQVLVASAIAFAGPGQQPLAAATAGSTFVAAASPVDHSGPPTSLDPGPAVEGRQVTVGEGDSWSGLAAHVLGDASLGPQLRMANVGRDVGGGDTVNETTAFVEPGWRLLIPADLDRAPSGTTAIADGDQSATWDVAEGDHFWSIAEATLTESWERTPSNDEIVPFWKQLVEANTDRLLPPEDPDLIYPEQEFVVPTPPADTNPSAEKPESPNDTNRQGSPPSSGWRAAIEGHDQVPTPTPEASTSGDGWRAAIEGQDPEVQTEHVAPVDDDEEERRTALGAPVGLTGGAAAATLLATGVVATIRWRRRTALHQRGPGMRLPTPLPEAEGEIATLDEAAAADEPLTDLGALLLSIPEDVHPVLVRVTDHGEVALYFDDEQSLPEPPPPWSLADDGTDGPVGWRSRIGDLGPERSFGLPLLVTLGHTGSSMLLANVAAMGTLALDGPPAEERRRLRAMTLEVATSRISVPVEVAVAGDERLFSLDQVRHIDNPSREVELAMDEIEQGVVLDDRTPRLLVCHHDITSPAVPQELTGMLGVAVAGNEAASPWVLVLEDEHTGRLRLPDGGTVQIALPDVDPEVIDDELTRLDEGAVDPQPEREQQSAPTAATVDPTTNGHPTTYATGATEPGWCEVRLLGPAEVLCNGQPVHVPPRAMELLVYLVTNPDGVPKERLENVIWAGHDPRGHSQRVTSALTKLRKRLGECPDGELLVPRRTGDQRIDLSARVSCDIDLALAHLTVARDLPAEPAAREVAAALELVRGEPFEGLGYSWATDISQRAIIQLQDAALDAARTLREAGDFEQADRVIQQGLKLLDPNGWLYLEQAQLERQRGHPEQPPRIFDNYRRKLADDADEIAGTIAIPPPEIELAFRELIAGT